METNIESLPKSGKTNRTKRAIVFLLSFSFTIALVGFCFLNSEVFKEVAMSFYSYPDHDGGLVEKDSIQLTKQFVSTQKKVVILQKKIESLAPSNPYLIINTTNNTFVLRTRKGIIREGFCSTGSYTLLDAGDSLQWIFKTPKGMFRVQGKLVDPLWVKPDWAFIEEGLPVPPKNHPDRYEYGTLGDYALSLGHGYLIHGTLYQRFLGLPVTHGCVRLGDDDLKEVYNKLVEGSRVYIY
ncbi:MAG: L,D-transpeptidase [Bacteroidales bacterium]|nr:L,D-transpeptidase [Bacteroidales bacterium]MDD4384672.1 L,D-transpeptidase [Bacteroidales bacterium]